MGLAVLGVIALAANGAQPDGFKLNDLGLAAASRGDYAEADRLYGEAMTVWKSLGPQYEAHLATTQGNVAEMLCMQGKRREGAKLFEESLASHRQTLGSTHLRTLTIMNLLGGTYLMLGNDQRAAALFNEALPVERELYPNDLQLARTLAGLGLLSQRAKKPEEALTMSEEALNIVLKTGGEDGLDAALAYGNVGEAHRWLGHTERALPLLRKARSIYERILGPTHPRVASVLSQEGLVYMQDRKFSLAEKAMVQSLELLAKSCPDCTFEQSVGESNLGLLRLRQGKYADADRLLTHVLSIEEQYLTQPNPEMARTLMALAQIREKQRRYEDAARLHKRADLIAEYR
ncbi:MAG: tetratricopeptide repeat protein [Acidobacteriia bacterium]|nr:tetratricopeptide repeat protein [Terriglobia bacterium]